MEVGEVVKFPETDEEYKAYNELADWCNASGQYHIEEIDKDANGNRRFQIVANPEPTAEEIAAQKLAEETSTEARLSALEDALAEMMGGAE